MVAPLILKSNDGNVAGYVRGNIFRKETAHKNMLNSPPGWSIGMETFEKLRRYGVDTIQMYDKDEKKLYVCSYNTFKENGLTVDRKNGKNAVLALSFWRVF
jgi:hypothetical protein